jgi:hypothetical protein
VQTVDPSTDIHALPQQTHGCSFVALPDPFNGKKEVYRRFCRQLGLFLTANRSEFKEKESMIQFALSYMKGGEVELWANSYINKALEENDWGTWETFLDSLAKDFGNTEEPRCALEDMGKLVQGKRTASEYFLCFKQLASLARVDVNRYPNAILYVKKNIQYALIDQLYQSDTPPTNYQDYKRRIIAMDEMRRRREGHQMIIRPQSKPWETSAMEVDRTAKKEDRKCYFWGKERHLASTCPGKEKKQGF